MTEYRAKRNNRRANLFGGLILCALSLWAIRHIHSLRLTLHGEGSNYSLIFAFAFLLLFWQMLLCLLERPVRVEDYEALDIDAYRVAVVIPVYNEDPGYLAACIGSIAQQTRPPEHIAIVDDGSSISYDRIRSAVETHCPIPVIWTRTENGGKRAAQTTAFRALENEADIFVTVDSDGILAPDAVEEILKPFRDEDVHSVAGIVLAVNNRKNLLSRLSDLWFVTGQLVDRSAASVFGSVLVNSGVLAAYRRDLVIDNLYAYTHETFFGRRVEFSDDSLLTLFALERGKAVQQPTAFAFTAMPETLSHHIRQYVRWMRGAFIRTWGRFRYLPLNRYAYWAHFIGWFQMALSTVIFASLFLVQPATNGSWNPWLLFIPVLIAYGQGCRYLIISRSDESFFSRLCTFLLAPIAFLWAFFVLRFVRWYAIATCLRTGWGTRTNGAEVSLNA